ncbi:ImmA/IrrE family metallo-endopeptidase [Acidipropionibacterium acidipropionici]|uniref:ImmA/IrrE family metallo-endopeptidase n=1 Tax=Acidipropionibacterium acidipropionici TaxID=1748 RepID=UPI00110BC359|nr:ImmA/IrrE family metallo-endopeptidase [Acidipropionibacterium acidipropionici]QCV94314.1 ImmA/IrrE family metallo-endopeptidase [Acidipropionibacterium acidipropionici]
MLIKEKAQIDAEDVRRKHWDGKFPVDPIAIARNMKVTSYLSQGMDDTSGLIIKRDGQRAEIFLNGFESKARQRFTCAHEVGHLVERQSNRDDEYSFRDERNGRANNPHEWYADHFAANLLMPQAEFERMVEDCGATVSDLVDYFGVSRSAILTRARLLKMDLV